MIEWVLVSLESVVDITYIVSRLRKLLKKKYVVRALLEDPEYRRKLFIVAGLLGIDLEEVSLRDQGFELRV